MFTKVAFLYKPDWSRSLLLQQIPNRLAKPQTGTTPKEHPQPDIIFTALTIDSLDSQAILRKLLRFMQFVQYRAIQVSRGNQE